MEFSPSPGARRTRDFDLLVVANPVWETAWLVDILPEAGVPPDGGPDGGDGIRPEAFLSRQEDGGGSALNTACALALAGRRVAAAGRLGDDPSGRRALEALLRRGVVSRIEMAAGRTTKHNHLFVERATRRNAFQVLLPALSVPPWEDEPPELCNATWLLLDRLAQSSPAWLRRRKREAELRAYLNRNSGRGTPASEERARRAFPYLDCVQLPERGDSNPVPAQPLTAVPDRQKLHRPAGFPVLTEAEVEGMLRAGVEYVVRTRGADGALLQSLSSETRERSFSTDAALPAANARHAGSAHAAVTTAFQPAFLTEVVDPTGAGDAFCAGFLDALLSGEEAERALERGADWAARACRYLGARGWLDHEPPP